MKIGDKISVLDEDFSGVISAIKGKVITVLTNDGFELEYSENELVIVDDSLNELDFRPHNISEILSQNSLKKVSKAKRVKPKERNLPPRVIDLHIHQLTSNTRGMDNYDMLNLQLDTAKRQLEFAILKRIPKIVFIHGVGEGILRTELEYLLKKYDHIAFYDADFQKYGVGATEVKIFQNKK